MNIDNNYGKDLSFRQIVLTYLQKIMDLNLKLVNSKNNINFVKCYKRAVLGLSDLLLPFFDSDMKEVYDIFLKDCKDVIKQTTERGMIKDRAGYFNENMRICGDLFRGLSLLLYRNDYLKSVVYGEGQDELVVDEEEEG